MSINSLGSLVHQSLLPHVEVVEQEIIHQWDVNDFVVCLIKKQDTLGKDILEYKTIQNQIEIYTEHIEILESKSLERMISQLKSCKVMLDENGIATFSRSYHTWENTPNLNAECEYRDTEISLIRGSEGLVWSVFQRITKESSFYSLQEATIPSLRCHPETIALIERIKTEGLNNALLLNRLMNDFKVRVISPKDLLKEYEVLDKSYNERMKPEVDKSLRVVPAMYGAGSATVYLSSNIIGAIAGSTRKLFGNGIFGTISTRATGFYTGAVVFSLGAVSTLAIYNYFVKENIDFYSKRIASLKKEKKLLSSQTQKPLFIEVEPISAPSIIDERVHVSKFTWAVTLVTHDGSNGNHAEIIVEGINDGFYNEGAPLIGTAKKIEVGEKFIHLAHYTPRLQSGLLSPDDLEYETRTEVWMVPSDKVKKMLVTIEEEKYLPKAQRRTFNRFGKNSKFYKFTWDKKWNIFSGEVGDNCFTWAREKLKILDIDLGEGFTDFVAAMAKNYTRNKEEYKDIPVQEMI